jgi:hypothetical protein
MSTGALPAHSLPFHVLLAGQVGVAEGVLGGGEVTDAAGVPVLA